MHQEWIPIDKDPLLPPALAALGFFVKPNVHLHPDGPTQKAHKQVTWMVAPMSQDGTQNAKELIPAWRDKSLLKSAPNHPLLAALFSLQTRQILADWRKGIGAMPHVVILPGSKLARAVPPSERSRAADISPHLTGPVEVLSLDDAAAAITAGHGVTGMIPQGCRITSRGAFSEIVPAATLAAAAAQIEASPARSATLAIPGFPPGEHPFLYALSAIRQARALQQWAESMDPTLHLNSRVSEKVALVSQSIMEGPSGFKEHVFKHLRS